MKSKTWWVIGPDGKEVRMDFKRPVDAAVARKKLGLKRVYVELMPGKS